MYCYFGERSCPYCHSSEHSFRPECFVICSRRLGMQDDSIFKVVESWYEKVNDGKEFIDINKLFD